MKPEDGKGIYDSIEIPEELDQIVRQSIAEAEKRRREKEAEEKNLTKTGRECSGEEPGKEKRSSDPFFTENGGKIHSRRSRSRCCFYHWIEYEPGVCRNDETDSGNRISGRSSDDPFVSPGRSGLQY